MKLKDVILSTLDELEHSKEKLSKETIKQKQPSSYIEEENIVSLDKSTHNEAIFLENIKERIHVLFEGFQSPNNTNIEAKVDLTLNFLEYILSSIEVRLDEIKEGK